VLLGFFVESPVAKEDFGFVDTNLAIELFLYHGSLSQRISIRRLHFDQHFALSPRGGSKSFRFALCRSSLKLSEFLSILLKHDAFFKVAVV
jgi:hypothetical protein